MPGFLCLSLVGFLLSSGPALAQASIETRERALMAYRAVFEAEVQRVSREADQLRAEAGRLEAEAMQVRRSMQPQSRLAVPYAFDRFLESPRDSERSGRVGGNPFTDPEQEQREGLGPIVETPNSVRPTPGFVGTKGIGLVHCRAMFPCRLAPDLASIGALVDRRKSSLLNHRRAPAASSVKESI